MRSPVKARHHIVILGVLAAAALLLISRFTFLQKHEEHIPGTSAIPSKLAPPSDSQEKTIPVSYAYKIINIFPHDPTAFTQGLTFDDGVLYEGTGGTGISTLRRVNVEDGKVLKLKRVQGNYFGEGITIYENKIIQLTYLSKTGLVYDKETFELLERFTYPTEGWGLTDDGTHLVMSDGTANLYFLDPKTYERRKQIKVRDHNGPVPFLNELEYIKGYIYANIWQSEDIAIIAPETGQVTGYIHLQGLIDPAAIQNPIDVLNGIAYDPENNRLFVTGKLWPELFEIELVPLQ
jgi:glutamine cyclotransferase